MKRHERIDIFATALHCGLTVSEISELDLSYTPPLSAPWDPVQEAAKLWQKHGYSRVTEQGRMNKPAHRDLGRPGDRPY